MSGNLVIPDPSHRPLTIPAATQTQPGVVTLGQVLSAGDYVALDLQNGFVSGGSPYGDAGSRLIGDFVQFGGLIIGPMAGTDEAKLLAVLPEDQRPNRAVLGLVCGMQVGTDPWAFNVINIDDADGTVSGIPGAVSINMDVPAGGALIGITGLWFLKNPIAAP